MTETGRYDGSTRRAMPSARALAVDLLRHGDVAGLAERRVLGHAASGPSALGLAQHARLTAWWARHGSRPGRIVSSDLPRCRHLAEALARELDVPLQLEPALREQAMGAWEGLTWSGIQQEHGAAVNDYWDDYVDARPPGGESLRDAAARILEGWDRHVEGRLSAAGEAATGQAAQGEDPLMIVAHSGTIRVLLCHVLGLPLDQALRFAPAPASRTRLILAPAGGVLERLGERPWEAQGAAHHPRGGAPLRLALSGSAGTGKTTLGRRLAESLGVPFLDEGMRRRLESGLSLHALSHDQLADLIVELWREQREAQQAASEGFVADRSAADYAAFWIHYGFHHDTARTDAFLGELFGALDDYDRIVVLPWGALPLVDDGVRSTNRWLQFLVQSLVEGLLTREAPRGRVLQVPESCRSLEQRHELVLASLERAPAATSR